MADANPIQKELEKLEDQWGEFVAGDTPVMRWCFPYDALRLGSTFIKVKEQFGDGEQDVVIQLDTPFESQERFGWDLTEQLNRLLQEGFTETDVNEEGGEQEKDAEKKDELPWVDPDLSSARTGFRALFLSVTHLIDTFGDAFDSVVLVITPQSAASVDAYVDWWRNAIIVHEQYCDWPERLKLVVFENSAAPLLAPLTESSKDRIYSVEAPVDMKAAMSAVVDEADDGSPGSKIRKALLQLNFAVSEQRRDDMMACAKSAVDIAEANALHDLSATAHMILAGGLLNIDETKLSIRHYQAAQRSAKDGLGVEQQACEPLLVQAAILEGTAWFHREQYLEAAEAYEKGALAAENTENALMALEGWRMSSFSLEKAKQKEAAWEKARYAFKAGRTLEPDKREGSTLAFLGQAMRRLAPDREHRNKVGQAFEELLGEGWEARLKDMVSA